jgi:hypothetical protein
MRCSPLLCLLLIAISPTTSLAAAASPPGVNLRWDNCYGDAGAWNKNFACDTNLGSERLVGSFELDQPLTQAGGVEAYLDLSVETPTLPAWWMLKNPGSCRLSSLTANAVTPSGSTGCVDWAEGFAAGGLVAYQVGAHGPSTARIIIAFAVPAANAVNLDPGQESFAFMAVISHAKTVGTGSCAGCDVPVCIFLSGINVATPPVAGEPSRDLYLDRGANYVGSQYVTWQNGYPIDVQRQCEPQQIFFCRRHYTTFDCVLATPTRTHGSTWGQVKSLYR